MGGQMQDNPRPRDGLKVRSAPRTNLFLAATLLAAGSATSVRIRDLSPIGAQVESFAIPEPGSAMTLTRGRLSVQGHVSWATERRCGLHFSTRVSIQEWMANPVNLEQQRVDHSVAAVKAGAVPLAVPGHGDAAEGLADDLTRVSSLLEMLGDALASDPAIVAAHGITLQNLDIALQTLTALAATVYGDGPERAAGVRRLDELRISGAQALCAKP